MIWMRVLIEKMNVFGLPLIGLVVETEKLVIPAAMVI